MNKQLKADLMLVLVTLCWGVSYILMDISLADMGPFTLNSYRFLGAFVVIALFSYKSVRKVNKTTLKYSLLVGTALFFVYMGATFGVMYTSLSNAGFLCALTVIFVPIFELVIFRKVPEKKIILAVTISIVGIMLLTLKDDFSFNLAHLKGDLFSTLCAFSYAADLLITDKALKNKEVNAYHLGVFQLGVTGVLMTIFAFIFETPVLPKTGKCAFAVIFLSLFCTGLAFIVQAIAQQYTTASHVGIIFTLEPVFAGIVAFFFAGEILSVKSYIGAFLMISALFITEIDFSSLGKKKEKIQM